MIFWSQKQGCIEEYKGIDLSNWSVKFILTTFIIKKSLQISYFTCELESFYLHCQYYPQKSNLDKLSSSLYLNGWSVLLSVVCFSHPIESKMMYIVNPYCV